MCIRDSLEDLRVCVGVDEGRGHLLQGGEQAEVAPTNFYRVYNEVALLGACKGIGKNHSRVGARAEDLIFENSGGGDIGFWRRKAVESAAVVRHGEDAGVMAHHADVYKRQVYEWGIATKAEAVYMATQAPAEANDIADECGSIRPGRNADFVVLNHDLSLVETYLGGESVYVER